ncbi:MAG: phosphoglycerate kinase [Bacilli bacterium]|nr:phosphoglycerate kinase [Bacilli bacterium]
MYKTIEDYKLKGKRVIIRCDFNVPIENGEIKDNSRIRKSLRTIRYARKEGAKVILLSHLGRIKTEEDKIKNTLKPIADELTKLLRKKVTFIEETRGERLEKAVKDMKERDVILIENTRYEDLNNKAESTNDKELGKYWSKLGDIFINDAFGTIHRSHASNVGISSNIKSGIGFLVAKEVKELEKLTVNPKKPYTIILGGSKVSDKINLIKNLAKKADYILIGGAMSFTFIKAAGFSVGASMCEKEEIPFCTEMLEKYPDKIILPIDIVTAKEIKDNTSAKERFLGEIEEDEIGLDIGKKTIEVFKQYIDESKTIFWNGPMGLFEIEKFSNGTKQLCKIISETKAYKIIGGGDTARAINEMGYAKKMNHISTGGGASLAFLEGKKLEALETIDEKE